VDGEHGAPPGLGGESAAAWSSTKGDGGPIIAVSRGFGRGIMYDVPFSSQEWV